jgi:hypothetical protein
MDAGDAVVFLVSSEAGIVIPPYWTRGVVGWGGVESLFHELTSLLQALVKRVSTRSRLATKIKIKIKISNPKLCE